MKRIITSLGIALALFISISCSNLFQSNERSYQEEFNQVYRDFDQNYSHFILKDINWAEIRAKYEPLVQSDISYTYFINNVLQPMLGELNDRHVSLFSRDGRYVSLDYPEIMGNYQYDASFWNYFDGEVQQLQNGLLTFGYISESIGYIRIANWMNEDWDGSFNWMNLWMEYSHCSSIILDVRPNRGGSEILALNFAGLYTDSNQIYAYHQFRNGPEHGDFTEMASRRFGPRIFIPYTKPVVLLMGPHCASSNEAFIMMMTTLPHVTSMGDTSMGSTGNPRVYSLEDGTTYRIPSWIDYDVDGNVIEDRGIIPDIPIDTDASIVAGRDMVLERAIQHLSN